MTPDVCAVVEVCGAPVGVRFDASVPASAIDHFRRTWTRCAVLRSGESEVTPQQWVYATLSPAQQPGGAAGVVRAESEHELQELLGGEITRMGIRIRTGGPLLLHAAAVEIQPGVVHGFVASSGTGKTTLARVMGSVYGYVTDELLAVDPADLTVDPYPKPLCIIADDHGARAGAPGTRRWDGLRARRALGAPPKDVVSPEELGLQLLAGAPLRLAGLHFLQRADGDAVEFEPIGTVEAMLRLAGQTSALSRYERPLAALHRLTAQCPVVDIARYGEAEELMVQLGELYAGRS